ncbi:beta-phosphoglucomutase [Thalassobacillus devorans]|uniref:Beta-phosphoglucomutase n=1 Tax=Thalassobacillus devorans TaxID=279813 RepID=A0ABQ1PTJ2_9BACI|nr:beta-phosphoglucomutase [Thalassobacillus devorans]NIK30774.1 beta-phosphoglucomutase [Thalassobacillus devorans]GGD03129.1 beta-phosphoglucomutase [Thalassobacillus devorans]
MKEIRGVLFDLDGVITDTAEYHFEAWKKLAEELDIPFDREFNERLKGVGRMESLELILTHGEKELSETEKDYFASKKNDHYKTMIANITPNDLLPGILEFMEEIKEAGIKTALASSSKNAQVVIERLEITHLLDEVVDAAKLERGKPDPEIFLKAAEQINEPATACAGVEDAQAGVDAIKEAGMFAVGVGSYLKKADWIVEDTSQLKLKTLQAKFQ